MTPVAARMKEPSADQVYKAAIMALGSPDANLPLSRAGVALSLTETLARQGVAVTVPGDGADPVRAEAVLDLAGHDGIVIALEGEDRSAEVTGFLGRRRWQRVHLLGVSARALSIKTVCA